MTNPLRELKRFGQSVWYDNLNRDLLRSGALQRMVDEDGVSGGTSNPSIFEKAVASSDAYDEQLREVAGLPLADVYDALTVRDIQLCCDVFAPVYEETHGADGFCSLEVSPEIANETEATIAEAKRLFAVLDRPNAMIKIPGTAAGLSAIEHCLCEGLNINITLLFGVENYEEVAWAYITALEQRVAAGLPVDHIASVASFFVSRVDTLVDKRLDEAIAAASSEREREHLRSLIGKAGVANAKIAYAKFGEILDHPRWKALAAAGARVQRPLWASTSTKNPAYRDVIYVEELIGPDTVNTMPQVTLDAFRDHGRLAATLEEGVDDAREHIRQLAEVGIDLREVTDELQVQGVDLFIDSFRKVNEALAQKVAAVGEQEMGAGATR